MRFTRLALAEHGGACFARIDGDRAELFSDASWLGGRATGTVVPFREADLLAPVNPYKILCIGRNYAAHAKELGNEVPTEPLLFLKPRSALVGHGGIVELPPESARVEHEAELGVVIGRKARHVGREQALDHVFGYTCVCDVTARDLQKKDGQWSRAKGFDTFCPCGPWIETDVDPRALRVRCIVNGVTKQDGSTAQMVFDVASLIEYASRAMTLEPGDLLVTGTPEGVGPLVSGDSVSVDIESIGTLTVTCSASRR
jgi:2-keto-4-pentenoate hydratase/2-oxohepta-3-ene-1,7-dioic acid hydratase in catechol pathway